MTEPAAPPAPPYTPPTDGAAVPAKRRGPSRARRFGDGLGTVVGEAIGFLVLFPLLMALMSTGIWLFFDGQSYEMVFAGVFALFFVIGLFFLVIKWGFQLFIQYWPLVILGVGAFIAWKALT